MGSIFYLLNGQPMEPNVEEALNCLAFEAKYGNNTICHRMTPDDWPKDVKLPVLLPAPSRLKDFMHTDSWITLVSDRAKKMMQEEGFTGMELRPVNAYYRNDKYQDCDIPKYWVLLGSGCGGIANPESGIKLLRINDNEIVFSRPTDLSLLVDETQWDGSDFFRVYPMASKMYVSERVVKWIKKRKLSGAFIQPLSQEQWFYGSSSKILAYPLRRWFPEDIARKLGEPLGIY